MQTGAASLLTYRLVEPALPPEPHPPIFASKESGTVEVSQAALRPSTLLQC